MSTFTIVQHPTGQNNSNTQVVAYPSNVAAGNLLAGFFVCDSGAGSISLGDSLNGAWTSLTFLASGSFVAGISCILNTLAGACTVTLSSTTGVLSVLMLAEVHGVLASALATDGGASSPGTGGGSPSTLFTTASGGDFLFAGMTMDSLNGGPGGGYNLLDNLGGEFVTQWAALQFAGQVSVYFSNSNPATGNWMVHGNAFTATSPSFGSAKPPGLLTTGVGR